MLLTPRYDDAAFLRVDLPLGDPAGPMLRQRRRLASVLGGLDADQWSTASRCAGWSVQDVIAHLVTTNQFWSFSIGAARAGEPSRFLTTFDPVATPAELVDAVRSLSATEVLHQFVETTDALADAVAGLDEEGWSILGEAPPGHVPLRAVVMHALWDSWIHERDIVLPLGLVPVEERDEVADSLRYAVALTAMFQAARGSTRRGSIEVDGTGPDVRFVVELNGSVTVSEDEAPADALRLSGPAVELLEALSLRAPLTCPVPDDQRWLLAGLAEVFDQAS
jgi:uncharacterized protein (TIGR03083 family)